MAEIMPVEKPVSKKQDKEFDPSAEMMVNDFDDERTLDEEEALEGSEDPKTELTNLQKEGDMPLEELLAMYGYGETGGDAMEESTSEEEELAGENEEVESVVETPVEQYSELQQLYADEIPTATQDGVQDHSDEEEEEEDYDYSPEEDECKKIIMVGFDFQAPIPEGVCKYDDVLPYENEDKMLWEPMKLTNAEVEEYLVLAHPPATNTNNQGVHGIPTGTHIKDDEQALYLLLQCGYSVDEALRRRRMNVITPTDTMSLWSEEECRNFENGLRIYGKDFHMIQQNKVRTRSVGELVQFYYLWKKTERHDAFANKSRLEKKKYNLHPGITDYMDRLLDEQESNGPPRDRSLSPMTHCLIYGDPKRQQRVHGSYGESGNNHTLLSSLSYGSNTPVPIMRDLPKHIDTESLDSFLKMAAASAIPECHLKDSAEGSKREGRNTVNNAEHHQSSVVQ